MACYKIFLFFLLIIFTPALKAQTALGIEAGISSSYLSTNISNRAATSIAYDIGYTINIPFQYKIKEWLYVETAPNITQKNYSINRTDSFAGNYESFLNTYLQLPIMAKFVFGKRLQWFADAGAYGGYWLSGRVQGTTPNIFNITAAGIQSTSYSEKYQFNNQTDNRFELGWVAGVGAQYHVTKKYMLMASARYYQSLTSQLKNYTVNEVPQYNQTFTFSIGGMMQFR
jgi:hypothetical protein